MTEDQEKLLDEIKRHVDVTAESLRGEIRLVAEGVLTVDDKLERFRSEVNTRFAAVDSRFDGVDKRFDGVDKRLDAVDKRLDAVDRRLEGVDKRLDALEHSQQLRSSHNGHDTN